MTNEFVGNLLNESIKLELVPYLNKIINDDNIWYPREICQYLAFNTIYHTMFGKRIERASELYNVMITDFDNTFKLTVSNDIAGNFPFTRWIKSFYAPIQLTRNRRNENVSKLITKRIEENKNIKETYIDYTYQLVLDGVLTQNELVADTYFLFNAGIDTTSSTLDFGVVLAAKYVNIQKKVRNELLSIMNDKEFNLKLVHKCPLFRAFIHEILRISSVAYVGVKHCSPTKDHWITVDNDKKYKIPKGMNVHANVDYIHIYNKNDKNWKQIDGDKICLDNFLSDDRSRFVMNESFIGFGVGRRDCVGRQLAMKEVQYILAYLLMNYDITLHKDIDNILDYRQPNMATVFMKPSIPVRIQKL